MNKEDSNENKRNSPSDGCSKRKAYSKKKNKIKKVFKNRQKAKMKMKMKAKKDKNYIKIWKAMIDNNIEPKKLIMKSHGSAIASTFNDVRSANSQQVS